MTAAPDISLSCNREDQAVAGARKPTSQGSDLGGERTEAMLVRGMTDWSELYRSLLGQKIAGIVWMPITSDTPQVAAELQSKSFSFSGAVHIRFESQAFVRLSWQDKGDRVVLATEDAARWVPHTLDRLQARWYHLIGSTLTAAELFTVSDDPARQVVAVKHETSCGLFWIGVGGADFVGDQDDLWVGVDCDPPNGAELLSVGVIS